VADVQTGFGPFISVYLTAHGWTQVDIGLILTARSLAGLALQMPGGAIVDAARSLRGVTALAMIAISASALVIAVWPMFASVLTAQILQAAGSSVVSPAIAAISLGLVGHAASGERFGRNARFASIGNGLAAAGMGVVGYFWSTQAVFLVTAAFIIPTLIALAQIRSEEIDPVRGHGGLAQGRNKTAGFMALVTNRPLLTFATCVTVFQLANAAMLPLVASVVTMRSSTWATTLVAAAIVVPQLVVATFSPSVGRWAQRWGRRPILLAGFAALPIRGLLLMVVVDPRLLVAVQLLDGICAAVFGVLVPLTIADITRGTGRFNLAQGIVGSGIGIGASMSTTLAGWMSDRLGSSVAFLGLGCIGAAGLVLTFLLMPETMEKKGGPKLLTSGRN
jgi:MFS family permease